MSSERQTALEKDLAAAAVAVPVVAAEHDKAFAALRTEIMRERESSISERQAHAAERTELTAQVERARLATAKTAEEAAAAVSRAVEDARANLDAEREASAAREAAAVDNAEAARAALDRCRTEAAVAHQDAVEQHAAEMAAANARLAERAAAFEVEMAKQREHNEVHVGDAKANASAQHESAMRSAAEALAAAEARAEAAQQSARVAAEHQNQQMRSLAREHSAALRAERQLAAQELAASRERAEDAERRLETARHGTLASSLSPTKPPMSPSSSAAFEEQWEGLRRAQEALGAAHSLRLSELGGNRRLGGEGSMKSSGVGGASAALVRRALLSESRVGTPRVTPGRTSDDARV